jgi:hypothetical protein
MNTAHSWRSPSGTVYPTTAFHWFKGQLAFCPVCSCRPCAPDCEEQAIPAPPAVERAEAVSIPLIGNGKPEDLVRAAFAEAARRKAARQEDEG